MAKGLDFWPPIVEMKWSKSDELCPPPLQFWPNCRIKTISFGGLEILVNYPLDPLLRDIKLGHPLNLMKNWINWINLLIIFLFQKWIKWSKTRLCQIAGPKGEFFGKNVQNSVRYRGTKYYHKITTENAKLPFYFVYFRWWKI